MSLLAPLGLLGLLGIVALIIIYIIKPNYQSKFITSTFIWQLSLKYKKKKIPINTLRNILLFICQVLILAGAAFILAQPVIGSEEDNEPADVILVIDASASMQTESNAETRLERAVAAAMADARTAFENDKKVSVILASKSASYLIQEVTADEAEEVYTLLDDIINFPGEYATSSTPDIDGAMHLAEQITSIKADTKVNLYTDTTYLDTGSVNVFNVAERSEWNVAILDVRATLIENLYRIEIDVATYGADARVNVECEILDVDGLGTNLPVEVDVYCLNDEVSTIVLGYITENMTEEEAALIDEQVFVTEFEQIYVHVSEYDSLQIDNQFFLYGGKKPTVKIQYYSTSPNTFWRTALDVIAGMQINNWTVEITEIKPGSAEQKVATEGFDIYIFEHSAPATVPSDGIVIYSDVSKLPAEAGVRVGSGMQSQNGAEIFLTPAEKHPIMNNVSAEAISVTQFTGIVGYDNYTPLMLLNDQYPLLLVKEDVDQKILLMPFSVHYSNIVATPEFVLLLNNTFKHFFPKTIQGGYVYEPGDTVQLNARAEELVVTGPSTSVTLSDLPQGYVVEEPGIYTMTQIPMSGNPVMENIYVKIPAAESDIYLEEDALTNPYFFEVEEDNHLDLLFYFALAVVMLLFIEWWLKSREQI